MRRVIVAALFMLPTLAACSSKDGQAPARAEGGEHIACALDGASDYAQSCAVDRVPAADRLTLIVRHPDGAFRRFAVVTDGRGLVVADGAEQAKTAMQGDKLAVTVDDDRYLFPAKMKPAPADAAP